ncbi:hypothetical protein J6590_026441 [Homalodisca vitripennis]|nr:hypothetical protein J6590_096873 [Homalodisca vitripennis]KAG8327107.1 hypothetical protein J6590_026441 [Homalodisca vitripennis]
MPILTDDCQFHRKDRHNQILDVLAFAWGLNSEIATFLLSDIQSCTPSFQRPLRRHVTIIIGPRPLPSPPLYSNSSRVNFVVIYCYG